LTGILDNVLGLIGNTPLVRLQGMESSGSARVLLKLENLNPGGSIKDRVALAMIEDAEARGVLTPGKTPAITVVEARGGNMGVALALVAAAKGYQAAIVMPENVPVERRWLIERFDATLHLTPSDLGMPGANRAAKRMEKRTMITYPWTSLPTLPTPRPTGSTPARRSSAQRGARGQSGGDGVARYRRAISD
jgi:cysteine synthase A